MINVTPKKTVSCSIELWVRLFRWDSIKLRDLLQYTMIKLIHKQAVMPLLFQNSLQILFH